MIGLMVLRAFDVYLAINKWRIVMSSLAAQALLEELNPAIGLAGAGALLQAASSNAVKGEEIILDALSRLLLEERIQPFYGGAFA